MDDRLLHLYQQQVQGQCEFSLMAISDLNGALIDLGAKPGPNDPPGVSETQIEAQNRIWFSISSLLNSVANISKLLWPLAKRKTAGQFPDRGEALRASLGVDDGSPLQYREVRNHFEHVDERFEMWWLESSNHNIATRTIGPLGCIEPLEIGELFEQFDQERLVVAFQGDLFELQPIADEVSKLEAAAQAALNKRYGFDPMS